MEFKHISPDKFNKMEQMIQESGHPIECCGPGVQGYYCFTDHDDIAVCFRDGDSCAYAYIDCNDGRENQILTLAEQQDICDCFDFDRYSKGALCYFSEMNKETCEQLEAQKGGDFDLRNKNFSAFYLDNGIVCFKFHDRMLVGYYEESNGFKRPPDPYDQLDICRSAMDAHLRREFGSDLGFTINPWQWVEVDQKQFEINAQNKRGDIPAIEDGLSGYYTDTSTVFVKVGDKVFMGVTYYDPAMELDSPTLSDAELRDACMSLRVSLLCDDRSQNHDSRDYVAWGDNYVRVREWGERELEQEPDGPQIE